MAHCDSTNCLQQETALCQELHSHPTLHHLHPEGGSSVHKGRCPVLKWRHQPLHPFYSKTTTWQEVHGLIPMPSNVSLCVLLLFLSVLSSSPVRPLWSSVTTVSWPIFSGSWWRRSTSIRCYCHPSITVVDVFGASACWDGVRNAVMSNPNLRYYAFSQLCSHKGTAQSTSVFLAG